jgi:glutamate synthase (NADPH/NADH) large chain
VLPAAGRGRARLSRETFRNFIDKEGQIVIGWRDVPTTLEGLGKTVIEQMPVIRQLFIGRGESCADQDAFERKLLAIRKQAQNPLAALAEKHGLPGLAELYMPSLLVRAPLSTRACCSPGRSAASMMICATRCACRRWRTRSPAFLDQHLPVSWKLAHPYRFIAHNGEINTVRGNVNWMNARRRTMESDLLGPDLDKMWPMIPHGQSDTACLDNALELLLAGGYSPGARRHDADSGSLGRQSDDGSGRKRLLRISCRVDGAVGRPCRRGLYRWPPDRRDAGSQRPAPRALLRHR